MDLPHQIFRAYDLRGIAGEEVTPEVFYRVGLAYGEELALRGLRGVALGGDNRPSTPELMAAFADGVVSSGRKVFDVGIQPTPVAYFAREMLGGVGVAIVTASHNPKEYNGLKLGYREAALSEEEIQALYHASLRAHRPAGGGGRVATDIHEAYADDWIRRIAGPYDLSVVADCGNGTAGLFEPALSARAVRRAEGLFTEPDANYPNHHPDPSIEANLETLSEKVRNSGADLGVGYDGDADRLGLVDERGRFVAVDRLMVLLWREILKSHPGSVALVEVKCSKVLWDELQRLGARPEFCRSGHAPIKRLLKEKGAPFAGELSGHMFFADRFFGYDDAFYAAGRVYELLGRTGRRLGDLLDELPVTEATPEIRFEVPEERKFEAVADVAKELAKVHEVVTVDGVRAVFPGGWALVRASNTQPVAVLRAEADTPAELSQILATVGEAATRVGFEELARSANSALRA